MAKVKFGDVIQEVKEKVDRNNNPYEFYVAGDHMDTEDLRIRRRGRFATDDVGPAFIRVFHSGQVLYGSRRTYLKKIAVADFDGVTANTTFVLETKNENVLRQRLIPFIMYTERFTEWAIKKSKGSTNPYVLFSDLADYEFDLPPIEKQDELVELLWSMVEAKEAYQELLHQTDELVKAQFIKRFGKGKIQTTKAGEIMLNLRNGVSPSKSGKHHERILTLSAVTQGEFDPNAWKDGYFNECPAQDKRIRTHEFYMCRGNGNIALVGTGVYATKAYPDLVFPDTVIAAQIDETKTRLPFLYVAWKMPDVRAQFAKNAKTTNGTYKINQDTISSISLIIPPLPEQDSFLRFVRKSDKSKSELVQAINSLDSIYKKILSENLG